MRAVLLEEYREDVRDAIRSLKVVERPVPEPRRGEVLIRVEAAPCNPSDLLFLQGKYGTLKTLPSVPGWEGAGTVVASGGGWLGGWLRGKRVACGLQEDRDGTWAQYFVARAAECIPLRKELPLEQAASLVINPLTALGLMDVARRAGHRGAVHTAGASQVGRMLLAIARELRFPLVHVVRREAQVDLLRSLGAEHVLNISESGFPENLKRTCAELQVTAAFEAIAGDATGTVLNAMPPGSTAFVYGALSEQACGNIDPIALIFRQKTVTGFYLGSWMRRRGPLGMLTAARRVQRLLVEHRIETTIRRRAALDEVVEGLEQYVDHMTDGKVLIEPNQG